jgi:hypothetical protein
MSERPKKGIVDPWRITEPLDVTRGAATQAHDTRINLDQIDFDRDLRRPRSYTFRARGGSICVHSPEIGTDNDALCLLVRCLFELLALKHGPLRFEEVPAGFSQENRRWCVPAPDCPSARLVTGAAYTPATELYFLRQTADEGLLRLGKLLCAFNRRGGQESEILKRWGVVPILR